MPQVVRRGLFQYVFEAYRPSVPICHAVQHTGLCLNSTPTIDSNGMDFCMKMQLYFTVMTGMTKRCLYHRVLWGEFPT